MKSTTVLLVLILLTACAVKKENTPPESTENKGTEAQLLINDIWVAESIQGEPIPSNMNKQPVLEFQIRDNRVAGNDGCNSFSGSIKILDNTQLVLGKLVATKMACQNRETTNKFNTALLTVRTYKIQKLRLILMDEIGSILMILKKVD